MTIASQEKSHYRYEQAQLRRRHSIAKIHRSSSLVGNPAFIIGLSLALMGAIGFFAAMIHLTSKVEAFRPVYASHHRRHGSSDTRVFLEDWVADMIDKELYRQDHRKEYEGEWMEKNKGAVLSRLSDSETSPSGYPSSMLELDGEDRAAFADHKRDERMAFLKPEKYCADRCVATGNCDIFEDFYELGPEDVLKFCEECVLFSEEAESDGGEYSSACEVPDAFYEKEPPLRP